MTTLLVGALVALAGLSTLLGGATVWLAKQGLGLGRDLRESGTNNSGLRLANEQFSVNIRDLSESLAQKRQELENEIAARNKAEEQRDRSLDALVAAGDPSSVAAGIIDSLSRLSHLSPTESSDPTGPG